MAARHSWKIFKLQVVRHPTWKDLSSLVRILPLQALRRHHHQFSCHVPRPVSNIALDVRPRNCDQIFRRIVARDLRHRLPQRSSQTRPFRPRLHHLCTDLNSCLWPQRRGRTARSRCTAPWLYCAARGFQLHGNQWPDG